MTPRSTSPAAKASSQVEYGWRLPNGRNADVASLPEGLGWTDVIQHPTRLGTRLSEVRTHPHTTVTFTTRPLAPRASLVFSVQWAGAKRARHPGLAESVSRPDHWQFFRLAETDEMTDYANLVGVTNDVMTLILLPERLDEMLEGWKAPALIEEMRKGAFAPSMGDVKMTPSLQRILLQIRTNPYRGAMAALYVEAKVCEWLAEAFAQMADHHPMTERPLGRSHRAALAARDLLMSNLGAPPSMEELARKSGLSQHRLNQLFREMFGATPFQCLTQWRMDEARLLLAAGELSVKQVAHRMGYAHLSSFSHAYSRRFGAPPTGGDFS